MKTLLKNILCIGFLLAFVACSEDHLEVYPTEYLSAEQVSEAAETNPDVAKGTLLGIYENLYRFGSGGISRQEDFGITSMYLTMDILCADLAHISTAYSRHVGVSELTITQDPDSDFNYMPWRFLYRIVNLSNLVIDGAGGNDIVPDTEGGKHTIGQAKALRGFAYFNLAHAFVNDISDLSKPVLPIYTSANDLDLPKSTLQEVFDQAIKDLSEAETLLETFVRATKIEVNQDIVRGLLARTYGALNNWPKAEEYAKKVIDSGNYPIMSNDEVALLPGEDGSIGGFNDVNSVPGIMWGINITGAGQGLASLFSWWGFMDGYSYSYAAVGNAKAMDIDLHANIKPDDIRRHQFSGSLRPLGKFYYLGAQNKGFGLFSGPQLNIDSDSHYMRVAEFYLLHAEAAAENGNNAAARTSLKALMDLRLENGSSYIDGLSGNALAEEAALQTRLELFAEGQSYFVMKRRRQTRTRGSNWLSEIGSSFSHTDERLTLEIPQNEILFNSNLNEQN